MESQDVTPVQQDILQNLKELNLTTLQGIEDALDSVKSELQKYDDVADATTDDILTKFLPKLAKISDLKNETNTVTNEIRLHLRELQRTLLNGNDSYCKMTLYHSSLINVRAATHFIHLISDLKSLLPIVNRTLDSCQWVYFEELFCDAYWKATQLFDLCHYKRFPLTQRIHGEYDELKKRTETTLSRIFSDGVFVVQNEDRIIEVRNTSDSNFQLTVPMYKIASLLGDSTQKRLRKLLVQAQIRNYEESFPIASQYSRILHVERRYFWMRRWISIVRSLPSADLTLNTAVRNGVSLPPSSWKFIEEVCTEMCLSLRRFLELHVNEISVEDDPRLVLRFLRKTNELERFLTNVCSELQCATDIPGSQTYSFSGWLTPSWEPVLNLYVEEVHTQLQRFVLGRIHDNNMSGNELQLLEDSRNLHRGMIMPSTHEMFELIRIHFERILDIPFSSFSSDMYRCFENILTKFGQTLAFSELFTVDSSKSTVQIQKAFQLICVVLNTNESCWESTQSLHSEILMHTPDEFRSELPTFHVPMEVFTENISIARERFINQTVVMLSPSIARLSQTSWEFQLSKFGVMDESAFCRDQIEILKCSLEPARIILTPTLMRSLLDKVVVPIFRAWMHCVRHLPHANQIPSIPAEACQQLRIDLKGIRNFLISFHQKCGLHQKDRFEQILQREYDFLDSTFQVLLFDLNEHSSSNDIRRFFDIYCALVPQDRQSVIHLKEICHLKGFVVNKNSLTQDSSNNLLVPEPSTEDSTMNSHEHPIVTQLLQQLDKK